MFHINFEKQIFLCFLHDFSEKSDPHENPNNTQIIGIGPQPNNPTQLKAYTPTQYSPILLRDSNPNYL